MEKRGRGVPSYSVLSESIMIPPPVSGLSVDSDAGVPPSAPPGIVNAGGFFFDMTFLYKYQSAKAFPEHVQLTLFQYLAVLKKRKQEYHN